MSHSTPQEQFLLRFEELHKKKKNPNSLEGVTAQWVEISLSKRNGPQLRDSTDNGLVEVDFLASFGSSIIDILEHKAIFKKHTFQDSSAKFRLTKGELFSRI
jgi:hypothetical protein